MNELIERLRKFITGTGEAQGKEKRQSMLMYLSFLAMAGIILMLLSSKIPSASSTETPAPAEAGMEKPVFSGNVTPGDDYESRIEKRLKEILTLIEGVGRVEVDVTLEQGVEYVYGFNTSNSEGKTDERDTNGGIRSVEDSSRSQNLVLYRDKNGDERPVIQTERTPKVLGVLIVAEGANEPRVNAEISRAVNTVLGVPLHKICVLPYKR